MKLKQALEEYERRKEKARKEVGKIRERYNRKLRKKIAELLRRIEKLENKDIPKNVDDNIRKIVAAERRNYVTALRNALSSVENMENLGKRLPDLAKLHVGHGKYLLIIFEKDVYAINRLLKELNEEYVRYYNELGEKELEEVRIEETLAEIEKIRGVIAETEGEIKELQKKLQRLEGELEEFYNKEGLDKLEESIKTLHSRIRSEELEIRSKASKLQKPVKRMRLGEPMAEELIRDTSIALRKPGEFIDFVKKIEPKLEAKQRKAAKWILNNLEEKVTEIMVLREELQRLKAERDEIRLKGHELEKELEQTKRLIKKKEDELEKLKNRLKHLENKLEKEIERLERILGTKINR